MEGLIDEKVNDSRSIMRIGIYPDDFPDGGFSLFKEGDIPGA